MRKGGKVSQSEKKEEGASKREKARIGCQSKVLDRIGKKYYKGGLKSS